MEKKTLTDFPTDALSTVMEMMQASPEAHARTRKLFEERLKEIGAELADFLDDAGYRYVGDSER